MYYTLFQSQFGQYIYFNVVNFHVIATKTISFITSEESISLVAPLPGMQYFKTYFPVVCDQALQN